MCDDVGFIYHFDPVDALPGQQNSATPRGGLRSRT